MNSGLSPSPALPQPSPTGSLCAAAGLKLKYCRYYAKDKTCFYGDECQFLHEDPGSSGGMLGLSGGPGPLPTYASPPPPGGGAGPPGSKKTELGGLEAQRLAHLEEALSSVEDLSIVTEFAGMDGSTLSDAGLTDSYFSTSFIGVNGFGSPADAKYPMMQWAGHDGRPMFRSERMTNSSSSPSLLNDSAKSYSGHDSLSSSSSLFNDFSGLSMSQRRKVFHNFRPSIHSEYSLSSKVEQQLNLVLNIYAW